MNNTELKTWLKDYINQWETNEQDACGWGGRIAIDLSASRKRDELIDDLAEFCEENNLPKLSAGSLLASIDKDYLNVPWLPI